MSTIKTTVSKTSNPYKYSTTPRESMYSYTINEVEKQARWEETRKAEREARARTRREKDYQDKWGEFA